MLVVKGINTPGLDREQADKATYKSKLPQVKNHLKIVPSIP